MRLFGSIRARVACRRKLPIVLVEGIRSCHTAGRNFALGEGSGRSGVNRCERIACGGTPTLYNNFAMNWEALSAIETIGFGAFCICVTDKRTSIFLFPELVSGSRDVAPKGLQRALASTK